MRVSQALCIALLTMTSGTLATENSQENTVCGVGIDEILKTPLQTVYSEQVNKINGGCDDNSAKILAETAKRLMEGGQPKTKKFGEVDKILIKNVQEAIFSEMSLEDIIKEGRKEQNADNMEFQFLIAMAETLIKNGESDSTDWGKVDPKKMEKATDDIFKDATLADIRTLKHADSPELQQMANLAQKLTDYGLTLNTKLSQVDEDLLKRKVQQIEDEMNPEEEGDDEEEEVEELDHSQGIIFGIIVVTTVLFIFYMIAVVYIYQQKYSGNKKDVQEGFADLNTPKLSNGQSVNESPMTTSQPIKEEQPATNRDLLTNGDNPMEKEVQMAEGGMSKADDC